MSACGKCPSFCLSENAFIPIPFFSYTFSELLHLLFEVFEQPEATLVLFQFEKIELLSVRTGAPLVHSYCSLSS